jgi:hypothetical protein
MPTRFSGGAMVPGRALMMTNVTPPLVRLTVGNGKAEIVGRGPMSAMLKERTADVAGTTVQEIRGIFLGGVEIKQPSGEQWGFGPLPYHQFLRLFGRTAQS